MPHQKGLQALLGGLLAVEDYIAVERRFGLLREFRTLEVAGGFDVPGADVTEQDWIESHRVSHPRR